MDGHGGNRAVGTLTRAAAVLVLLGATVACGRSPPPPMATAPDPCSLLSPQRAAALLGVSEVQVGAYGTPGGAARGCAWDGAQGQQGANLTLNLALGPPGDDRVEQMFDANREGVGAVGESPETVAGVGDEAFWQPMPGVLHVRSGTCYLTLSFGGSAKLGARASLPRLAAELLAPACRPMPEAAPTKPEP